MKSWRGNTSGISQAEFGPCPERVQPHGQQRKRRQHHAEREQRLLRDRRGEPDADRGDHHLPEADQRRCRASFSPNGESACAVPKGLTMPMPSRNTLIAPRKQEPRAVQRRPAASRRCRWRRPPIRSGSSGRARSAGPVCRQHARGEHDQHGALEEQAQLDRREVHRLDQDAGQSREHREQSAHDQAYGCSRHYEAAIGDQAQVVPGDGERIERGSRCVMGLAEHRAAGERAEHGKGARPGRTPNASRTSGPARRRAAARSRGPPPSRS